jgi:hypothetical protein
MARRALAERLRAPLLSADGRFVATSPGVDPHDEGRTVLLSVLAVDTSREARSIAVRSSDAPGVRRARLDEAAAFLDGGGWTALTAYDVQVDPSARERFHGLGSAQPMEAAGEGLRVRFHEPALIVEELGGRTLHRRAYPGWSERRRDCLFLADLDSVWASRERGVLLVTIRHSGSPHFCVADPSVHAVRLPRR